MRGAEARRKGGNCERSAAQPGPEGPVPSAPFGPRGAGRGEGKAQRPAWALRGTGCSGRGETTWGFSVLSGEKAPSLGLEREKGAPPGDEGPDARQSARGFGCQRSWGASKGLAGTPRSGMRVWGCEQAASAKGASFSIAEGARMAVGCGRTGQGEASPRRSGVPEAGCLGRRPPRTLSLLGEGAPDPPKSRPEPGRVGRSRDGRP